MVDLGNKGKVLNIEKLDIVFNLFCDFRNFILIF